MKKNGFIATSILYSFFLVFITLFVSLVANYIHNQVLIRRQNEESREKLMNINNMDITKISVGEYVKFQTSNIEVLYPSTSGSYKWDQSYDPYLKETNWIYAYKVQTTTGTDYYFISDTDAIQGTFVYRRDNNRISPVSTSMNTFNNIKDGTYDGYDLTKLSLVLNKSFPLDNGAVNFKIDFLNVSTLKIIKEYAWKCMNNPDDCKDPKMQYNFAVNKNIFYSDGGFVVKYDEGDCAYKDITGKCYYKQGDHSGFYYIESKMDVSSQIAKGAVASTLCGVTDSLADGLSTKYVGNMNNPLSFVGVEGPTNSGIIGDQYQSKADFCNYTPADEISASTGNIGIRLQLILHVDNGSAPIHIDSGRGTDHDAYLIKDGKKH